MKKLFILIVTLALCISSVYPEIVLFSDDFTNESIWPTASGVNSAKTANTTYGAVEYLNLSIYPTKYKTYSGVQETGYIDFCNGSSTINDDNSYFRFPEMTFVDGGTINITYGAGSTKKVLQLQELVNNTWSNVDYIPATTVKSSVWYDTSWDITGSGKKSFRIVLASSSHVYVSKVKVATNEPTISMTLDTLNFGSLVADNSVVIKSLPVMGTALTSVIYADVSGNFKVSPNPSGEFYSSTYLEKSGGTLYISFMPVSTLFGSHLDSLTFSSSGADNVKVYLKAAVRDPDTKSDVINARIYDGTRVVAVAGGVNLYTDAMLDYQIFTFSGNRIRSGSFSKSLYVSLPKDIYIVRVGTFTYKVFVR